MAVAALKIKPRIATYHATMLVTRTDPCAMHSVRRAAPRSVRSRCGLAATPVTIQATPQSAAVSHATKHNQREYRTTWGPGDSAMMSRCFVAVVGLIAFTHLVQAIEYKGTAVAIEDGDTFTLREGGAVGSSYNDAKRICSGIWRNRPDHKTKQGPQGLAGFPCGLRDGTRLGPEERANRHPFVWCGHSREGPNWFRQCQGCTGRFDKRESLSGVYKLVFKLDLRLHATVCRTSTNRGRIVAQCFVGDLDIAAEMVRSGHACAWPKHSGDYYRLNPSTWGSIRIDQRHHR